MQPPKRLQLQLLVLVGLAALAVHATPQRFEDLVNQILPQAGSPDKTGNYNVFFIPAYRLAPNKTAALTAPTTTTPTPNKLDPRTSARLLTAALSAAARLTAPATPPPPSHTTPVPTLPSHAGHFGQLVRREQPTDGGLPPQHHDAHILVTLQNYGQQAKQQQQQQAQPVQQGAVGYGSAQHFNNYPAVDGHVPAHYGHLPYYGHFPVPVVAPSAASGPGGLLYAPLPGALPRFSAAASALDLVSSSPIAASHPLGTTGPLYASPGRPAGTLNSLGSLASAAASASSEGQSTTVEAATTTVAPPEPTTTMAPTTMPSMATAAEATEAATNPKDDAEGAPRTTPFRQTFEFGRTDSSRRLNLTEEVEVTGGVDGSQDVTTQPPPTPATQQTSPATDVVTEVKDLNSPPPTGQAPTPAARDDAPAGPQPPPYPFHPAGAPGAYPTGLPLGGGYQPPEFRFRHDPYRGDPYRPDPYRPDLYRHDPYRPDPYRDPRFEYQPQQQPQQGQQGQQKPQQPTPTAAPAANRNPNYPGNYDPFFGGYVPGFAPGYPFGVPPHGQGANAPSPQAPFGSRPALTGFGPPYGPFPATNGPNGGGSGGSSSAGGSGGSSQEAGDEPEGRPERLQAGAVGGQPTGSAEELGVGGRQPFPRQQQFGFPGALAQLQQQLPFSGGTFQSAGPDGAPGPGAGFGGPNSFYRPGVAAAGQGSSQFQDDFLSRQRLLYPGPSAGAQQQFRSPLFTPQQSSLGLDAGRGGSGGGGSLFSAQRPFSFNNPLFFPTGGEGDVEPRQSQLKQYTAPEKLVSTNLDVEQASGLSDLLSSVASLGTVPAPHTLERRQDASTGTATSVGRPAGAEAAKRVGFYSATKR